MHLFKKSVRAKQMTSEFASFCQCLQKYLLFQLVFVISLTEFVSYAFQQYFSQALRRFHKRPVLFLLCSCFQVEMLKSLFSKFLNVKSSTNTQEAPKVPKAFKAQQQKGFFKRSVFLNRYAAFIYFLITWHTFGYIIFKSVSNRAAQEGLFFSSKNKGIGCVLVQTWSHLIFQQNKYFKH